MGWKDFIDHGFLVGYYVSKTGDTSFTTYDTKNGATTHERRGKRDRREERRRDAIYRQENDERSGKGGRNDPRGSIDGQMWGAFPDLHINPRGGPGRDDPQDGGGWFW